MKAWWRRVRAPIIGRLGGWFVRLIQLTLRIQVAGVERPADYAGPVIYVGWHGKTFVPGRILGKRGYLALVSLSRDGEIQHYVVSILGYKTIRGSTGRGGARALMEAIQRLRGGESMVITPDGPRGPIHKVQPGVLAMAQKSGALLVPVGSSAKWCKRAGTWDHYMFPLPFSRGIVVFGEPIQVPAKLSEEELEHYRVQVEEAIVQVEASAESAMGHGVGAT